jgi:hypothetical protein
LKKAKEGARRKRDAIAFQNDIKEGDNAALNGEWKNAEENYQAADSINHDNPQVTDKLTRAKTLRNLQIPNDANVCFFPACNKREIIVQIANSWKKLFLRNIVSTEKWPNEWPILLTRIYYLRPEAKQVAENIANWLPIPREVIDYALQLQNPPNFPDAPLGHTCRITVDQRNTLGIFVGANYEAIAHWLDATVNVLPDKDMNEIKASTHGQELAWEAANRIVRVRVTVTSVSEKGWNDHVSCTILRDGNPISDTFESGRNQPWKPGQKAVFDIDLKGQTALLFADRRKAGLSIDIHEDSSDFQVNYGWKMKVSVKMFSALKNRVYSSAESKICNIENNATPTIFTFDRAAEDVP